MPRSRLKTPVVAALFVVLLLGTPISYFYYLSHEQWTYEVQQSQDNLDAQVRLLRSGERHSIYLYDTRNTDHLVEQLAGMTEVESLTFEMTDSTEEATRHMATLPKLKYLTVYASFVDLARLRGSPIERLDLINAVGDDDLKHLAGLPNLKVLHIFYETTPPGTDLSDRGLEHIAKLSTLRELYINSGWASPGALKRLQEALQDCSIFIDKGPPRQ